MQLAIRSFNWLLIFSLLFPGILFGEIKSWTGYGGDAVWTNPLNWSGGTVPESTDDVLLDNTDLPVSYQVTLPDGTIVLKSILINPSPGRNIELILPATNVSENALTVTGPGYGIGLKAGAIFRNASGLSSGESLSISDSIIIYDGGRYIHQTRASHANNILRLLSTAAGTEQGIFDFDVPRASYTISISNRTYGSLELHSTAQGSMVNYTCSGANPLLIRGNLRIGSGVTMSIDLSGINGNIQVEGDFIQEGSQLNLASGTGDNSILRIMGDLYQTAESIITETSNGLPYIELNGTVREQEIAMAGKILNQVGFRINNPNGCMLRLPLKIPWKLDLTAGAVYSYASALLTLDSLCTVVIDSTRLTGTYVDGPLRKLGLVQENHFLFPVGKDGNLRWLELKNVSGNYTVEYIHQSPQTIGNVLGTGLDHISKVEYWTIMADGNISDEAKVELSFASSQSGTVTDPDYLNVAKFQSSEWMDAGHTGITGNFQQGSVLSAANDFSAIDYTLASVVNLENPLPLNSISLNIHDVSGSPVFIWTFTSNENPAYFNLYEIQNGGSTMITRISAIALQNKYSWTDNLSMSGGDHYFKLGMVDFTGNEYFSAPVRYIKELPVLLRWVSAFNGFEENQILIYTENPDTWQYEIISMEGRSIKKGILNLAKGFTYVSVNRELISRGKYIFRAADSRGRLYVLSIGK